jgi:formylglycine-generating enzyme required for sulfatase activity
MGSNPSFFKGGQNPVEKVSWNDTKAIVRKLSEKTGKKTISCQGRNGKNGSGGEHV